MCSIESVRHSSHATGNNKSSHRATVSLKLIEKRLTHLRQELHNLTKKEPTPSAVTSEQIDDRDDHQVQYRKRLNQLLRLHDKQVGRTDERPRKSCLSVGE